MRILQLDVNSIEFELIEPEAKVYEKSEEKKRVINDAVVLLTSIEKGDNEGTAKDAIDDAVKYAKRIKRDKIVIYPFAHLSSNLEVPEKAIKLLEYMTEYAKKSGVEVEYAPAITQLCGQSRKCGRSGQEHRAGIQGAKGGRKGKVHMVHTRHSGQFHAG